MALRSVIPYSEDSVLIFVDIDRGLATAPGVPYFVGTLHEALRLAASTNRNWVLDSRYATTVNAKELSELVLDDERITKFAVRKAKWQGLSPVSDTSQVNDSSMSDSRHGGLYYIGDWLKQQYLTVKVPQQDKQTPRNYHDRFFTYSEFLATERRFPYPIRIITFDETEGMAESLRAKVVQGLDYSPDIAIHKTTQSIFKTHKRVLSEVVGDLTPVLFLDADFEPLPNFLQHIHTQAGQDMFTHVWHVTNPVNTNVYGHGGPKLIYPTAFDNLPEFRQVLPEDMTLSSGIGLVVHDTVVGVHNFTWSAFSTWRTAFREAVKLSLLLSREPDTSVVHNEASFRLDLWLDLDKASLGYDSILDTKARGISELAAQGARHGVLKVKSLDFDPTCVNNYSVLYEMFKERHAYV
jgi:hypothetical protein